MPTDNASFPNFDNPQDPGYLDPKAFIPHFFKLYYKPFITEAGVISANTTNKEGDYVFSFKGYAKPREDAPADGAADQKLDKALIKKCNRGLDDLIPYADEKLPDGFPEPEPHRTISVEPTPWCTQGVYFNYRYGLEHGVKGANPLLSFEDLLYIRPVLMLDFLKRIYKAQPEMAREAEKQVRTEKLRKTGPILDL